MAVKKTDYDRAVANLKTALAKMYDEQNSIKRDGQQIVIPANMTIDTAIQTLVNFRDRQESKTDKQVDVTGHIDDSLVALKWALENLFGNIVGESVASFFSYTPGQRSAKVGYNQTVTVPFGKIEAPGLELSLYVEVYDARHPMRGVVRATFSYRRKYQPMVDQIEVMWRERLAEHSIFKGQAIDSGFEFINLESSRESTQKLVYTVDEARALNAHIFTPIMHPERLERAGISRRRTVVLNGPYGTGKSLTAALVAQRAVEHGWTFMGVRPGHPIVEALEFARKFQPAVLFFEDIDSEASGRGRDDNINQILNSVDSILDKTTPVVTIMTTNHLERVHRAMLRPGRIDAVIQLGAVTEQSIAELVQVYVGENMTGDLDARALMNIANQANRGVMTPAFWVEALQRAQLYAIAENGGTPHVNQDLLVSAVVTLIPQWELMLSDAEPDQPPTLDQAMRQVIAQSI